MGATCKVLVLKLHSSQLRLIPYRHMKVAESYEFSILLKLCIAWDLGSTHVKVPRAGIQNMLSGVSGSNVLGIRSPEFGYLRFVVYKTDRHEITDIFFN